MSMASNGNPERIENRWMLAGWGRDFIYTVGARSRVRRRSMQQGDGDAMPPQSDPWPRWASAVTPSPRSETSDVGCRRPMEHATEPPQNQVARCHQASSGF
jgi:hypothetical protein